MYIQLPLPHVNIFLSLLPTLKRNNYFILCKLFLMVIQYEQNTGVICPSRRYKLPDEDFYTFQDTFTVVSGKILSTCWKVGERLMKS